MKIHIKQPEIEIALRDYITKLGINLQGRAVEVSFTSGRKNNGLSADIDISDVLISLDTVAEVTPAPVPVPATTEAIQPVEIQQAPSLDEAQEEEEALEVETASSTTSLFSS